MKPGNTATQKPSTAGSPDVSSKAGGKVKKDPSMGSRPPDGPDENAPPLRFGVIWRLGKTYFGRHPVLIAGYIVTSLLTQSLLQPLIVKRFAKLVNSTVAVQELISVYGTWVAFTLLYIALGFCLRYLTTALDLAVSNAIRRDVFARILRQGPRFFHEHDEGTLTMLINQICIEAQSGLRHLLVDPVLQFISLLSIGSALYLGIAEVGSKSENGGAGPLFAVVAVLALLSPWLVSRMGKRLQRNQLAMQRQNLGLASLVSGAVKAPEEIQAMRAEDIFDRKHVAALEKLRAVRLQGATTIETLNLCNRLPGDIALWSLLGIAVYISVHASFGGSLSPGTLVAVAGLTPPFMVAVQALSGYSISVSLGWPAIVLIDNMLAPAATDRPQAAPVRAEPVARAESIPPTANPQAAAVHRPPPTLEIDNITFSYAPERLPPVLKQVSFSPQPGRITGLVARAGQGKTTIFRLGLRFYDPQEGTIRLDGVSHLEIPLHELRRRIVMMAQFPAFFADTVRENFLLAQPDATDADIRRWAEFSGVWRVLERCYPQGDPLDAPFQAGAPLSGGQRKLFALTRCLLRDPDLLFLDEPTTGMDPETKFDFVAPMRASCEGRTVLCVDHDILWQIRFCDDFLVLDAGKIVEQGSGRELLAKGGIFRELFEDQIQGLRELLQLLEELNLPTVNPNPPPSSSHAVENR